MIIKFKHSTQSSTIIYKKTTTSGHFLFYFSFPMTSCHNWELWYLEIFVQIEFWLISIFHTSWQDQIVPLQKILIYDLYYDKYDTLKIMHNIVTTLCYLNMKITWLMLCGQNVLANVTWINDQEIWSCSKSF